jgi:preprotein translocase subunit SecA
VLNAKLHQKEADIVAKAGQKSIVTIATNMAGRGTDIKLTPEVKEAGGLAIIGTERHESRRVDNQLRGRAGRQGDPGSSVFFVSFEDKVMRLFASERVVRLLDRLGLHDGEMIESPMVTKSIENAQKRVEENNFGIRKHTLEYDDVMNYQRNAIYTRRHHALLGERIGIDIMNTIYDSIEEMVNKFDPSSFDALKMQVLSTYAIEPPFDEAQFRKQDSQKSIDLLFEAVMEAFKRKTERLAEVANPVIQTVCERQMSEGAPEPYGKMRVPITDGRRTYGIVIDLKEAYDTQCKCIAKAWQKAILLLSIDENWKTHLRDLDQLRQSVQNASYEQKDPLVIYKLESFNLFQAMLADLNNKAISSLMRGQIPTQEGNPEVSRAQEERRQRQRYNEGRGQDDAVAAAAAAQRQAGMSASQAGRGPVAPIRNEGPKIGRNDPCPCGSGKKYKNCHGKL